MIDQDYVLVSGPPLDMSSSSASTSKPSYKAKKIENPLLTSVADNTTSSAPMPIIGASRSNFCHVGSLDSQNSAPGTSLGSMDTGDTMEQPSTHCVTRIKSLQRCASAIKELVNGKVCCGVPICA